MTTQQHPSVNNSTLKKMSTQAPAGITQSECVNSELKPEVSPKLGGSEAQQKWDCVWFPHWCFIYSTGGLWLSTGDREESTTEFPTSGGWQPEKQTENNWQTKPSNAECDGGDNMESRRSSVLRARPQKVIYSFWYWIPSHVLVVM